MLLGEKIWKNVLSGVTLLDILQANAYNYIISADCWFQISHSPFFQVFYLKKKKKQGSGRGNYQDGYFHTQVPPLTSPTICYQEKKPKCQEGQLTIFQIFYAKQTSMIDLISKVRCIIYHSCFEARTVIVTKCDTFLSRVGQEEEMKYGIWHPQASYKY